MKKVFLFITICFISTISVFSQCDISPFIQDNYEIDAKVLALRDIINNPSDPDYDNPFLPEERVIPFLEKLSAIYENPTNNSSIDSLFNEFQIHANWEYFGSPNQAPFKIMHISINNSAPWLEDFLNTGISGFPELDNLINEYQFTIHSYFEIASIERHVVYIETNFDFLNITALLDDFIAVEDVESSYPIVFFEDRFNYNGISYTLSGEPVTVCDISINEDIFRFSLFSGDCPAGCLYSKSWNVQVSEDCEVTLLANQENITSIFSIYSNPVSEIFHISNLNNEDYSIRIYSILGKQINTLLNSPKSVNVSDLRDGIYFVEITTSNGIKQVKKIIKN